MESLLVYDPSIVTTKESPTGSLRDRKTWVDIVEVERNHPELFNCVSKLFFPYHVNNVMIQREWANRQQAHMEMLMALPFLPYGVPPPPLFQLLMSRPDVSERDAINKEIEAFVQMAPSEQRARTKDFVELQKRLTAQEATIASFASDETLEYETAIDPLEIMLLYMEVFEVLRVSEHPIEKEREAHKRAIAMADAHRNEKLEELLVALVNHLESNDAVAYVKTQVCAKPTPKFGVFTELKKSDTSQHFMKAVAKVFFDESFPFIMNYIRTYETCICICLDVPKTLWKSLIIPGTLTPMSPKLFSGTLRRKLFKEQLDKMIAVNRGIGATFDTHSVEADGRTFRGCLSDYALYQMVEFMFRRDMTETIRH